MQQTPKPLAHVPDAIPPLLAHSELKKHELFYLYRHSGETILYVMFSFVRFTLIANIYKLNFKCKRYFTIFLEFTNLVKQVPFKLPPTHAMFGNLKQKITIT